MLDADITGFFDNLPHEVIMRGLTNVVADGNVLRLVERFLAAGVMEEGVFYATTVGTPQGGVLSPLLANLALNFLDWHLARHGFRLVRYADDFVVLCRTARRAKEARQIVEYKRKSRHDNRRLKVRYLQRMGVVFLSDYLETSRC